MMRHIALRWYCVTVQVFSFVCVLLVADLTTQVGWLMIQFEATGSSNYCY